MKERPILFSAPMVRAILAGTKTQTRRIVKRQYSGLPHMVGDDVAFLDKGRRTGPDQRCPYGVPSDQLYVKEAWHTSGEYNRRKPSELPDDAPIEYLEASDYGNYFLTGRYRHARFMMRWMSRITLDITAVHVERLQDISEEDAIAEGTAPYRLPVHPAREALRHVDGYAQLWDSINGAGSWSRNPWVWVVCFRRVTP